MLEKILAEKFRKTLKLVFSDISNQQDRRDEQEFVKDEVRIREKLLTSIDTYPSDVVLDDDFLVAAVDGSGTESLVTLDDIRVHLLSTSTIVLTSNTHSNSLFSPRFPKVINDAIKMAKGKARGTKLADVYNSNSAIIEISNPFPTKSSIYFHRNCIKRINRTINNEIIKGGRKDLIKYKFNRLFGAYFSD